MEKAPLRLAGEEVKLERGKFNIEPTHLIGGFYARRFLGVTVEGPVYVGATSGVRY